MRYAMGLGMAVLVLAAFGVNLGCMEGGGPMAAFTPSVTSGVVPLSVSFTDLTVLGTGMGAAWNWDFGDGGASTAPSPGHTYAAAGAYTVTLTVTTSLGSAMATATIVVSESAGEGEGEGEGEAWPRAPNAYSWDGGWDLTAGDFPLAGLFDDVYFDGHVVRGQPSPAAGVLGHD